MDVIIDALSIAMVNISMGKSFDFNLSVLDHHDIGFKKKNMENSTRIFISYCYTVLAQENDGKYEIKVDTLYELTPTAKIDSDDVYLCVQLTQERMLAITDAIFAETLNTLKISRKTNGDMKKEIDKLVASIHSPE